MRSDRVPRRSLRCEARDRGGSRSAPAFHTPIAEDAGAAPTAKKHRHVAGVFDRNALRGGPDQPVFFHLPSAAMPLSRARWATIFCAAAKLPLMSLAHSFIAADCMARP